MAIRPESSVSIERNEFGELEFACDRPGPVIHRTPEELGIPRVVADVKQAKPTSAWVDRRGYAFTRRRKTAVDKPREGESRRIVIEPKKPAVLIDELKEYLELTAGLSDAELLDGFVAERQKSKEGKVMRSRNRLTEETKAAIVLDAKTMTISELHVKWKFAKSAIYRVLNGRGVKAAGARNGAGGHAMVAVKPKHVEGARPVQIDAARSGTASALIDALAKVDAAEEKIDLQLTLSDIAVIVGRMDAARRSAFMAAGLKAALLG